MSEVVTRVEDAQDLLKAKVLSLDIETDTESYHWESNWKRGLSYNADITFLSVYAGPKYPLLVLQAQRREVPYSVEVVEWDEIEGYRWMEKDHEVIRRRCLKDEWVELGEPTEECDIGNLHWVPNPKKGQYGYIDEKHPLVKSEYRFSEDELSFLRALLNRPITLIGHNLIFDARHVFGRLKIPVHPGLKGWDTQAMNIFLLGYEQDPYRPRGGLNTLLHVYERECGKLPDEEKKFLDRMKKARSSLHEESSEDVLRYVAWDSKAAYEIAMVQSEKEYEVPDGYANTFDQLLEYELDYTRWTIEVCARGIRLDVDYLKRMVIELEHIVHEETVYLGVSREQLGSVVKLRNLVFDQWGIPYPTDKDIVQHAELLTQTNSWAMSDDALKWYEENAPDAQQRDLVSHLRRAKHAHERIRSLGETYRHAETDGRIHTLLARHAVTGRNTSGSPNLQNLTFHGDYSDKGLLIPDPGYVLIEQDYSNAEVWSVAMNAGDRILAKACCSTDFHSVAARGYFGAEVWDTADKVERKSMRGMGKAVTFGVNYGIGARSLARNLTQSSGRVVSQEEAQSLIDGLKRTFQTTAYAMDETSKFADEQGYTILWTGRIVKVLSYYDNGVSRGVKGYTAWNSRAQGGVGEMITQAIVKRRDWLREREYKSWDCLQVHDSILTQVRIDEYMEVIQPLIGIMQNIVPDSWLDRTLPYRCRFLVTVDHSENSGKWGWRDGADYPFDRREYVNVWGFHKLKEDEDEAPTWINEWGYGEEALAKELAYLESIGIRVETDGDTDFVRKRVSSLLNEIMDRMSYYAQGKSLDDYLERLLEIIERMDQNRYHELVNSLQAVLGSEPEDVDAEEVRRTTRMLMSTYPYHNHFYDISELWPRAQRHDALAVECVADWMDKQMLSAIQIFKRLVRDSPEMAEKLLDMAITA